MQRYYLALERDDPQRKPRVRLSADLGAIVRTWNASTRVSPIYRFQLGLGRVLSESLDSIAGLVFIGRCHPSDVVQFGRFADVWLTLGLYNVVVATRTDADTKRVVAWTNQSRHRRVEAWSLRESRIEGVKTVAPQCADPKILERVETILSRAVAADIRSMLREYAPLMASGIARSACSLPDMVSLLESAHDYVDFRLRRNGKVTAESVHHEQAEVLLNINAALSRLTSQTFSGTSPIAETECHYWVHSLLGTGIANLGLWRLCDYPLRILGEEKIVDRLEALERIRGSGTRDLSELEASDPFWRIDHLAAARPKPTKAAQRRTPLIPYLSGRDNFKATIQTISAPLASIEACNSRKWTLLTLTHEIAHIVVRGAMGVLYPSTTSEIRHAQGLLSRTPANLLDSVRKYLLLAVLYMEEVHHDLEDGVGDDLDSITDALRAWHAEVEEILVHVVDFLYFYGGDVDKYVKGIWTSWSVLPNISDRLPEYVLRSVSAVMALYLGDGVAGIEIARKKVLASLRNLEQKKHSSSYIQTAIEHLSSKTKWSDLRQELKARMGIVRVGERFLVSEESATRLLSETYIAPRSQKRKGYHLRPGDFTNLSADNPLYFIDAFTTAYNVDPLVSFWMYYVLAFSELKRAHGDS